MIFLLLIHLLYILISYIYNLTHYPLVTAWILVDIGLVNGLLSDNAKTLSKPMLTFD